MREKSLLERKLKDPHFRKRFEREYEFFKLESQILSALADKNWSYSDLAKAMHTNKSNISRDLKAGRIQYATISRIRKIAEALGMKLIIQFVPK